MRGCGCQSNRFWETLYGCVGSSVSIMWQSLKTGQQEIFRREESCQRSVSERYRTGYRVASGT